MNPRRYIPVGTPVAVFTWPDDSQADFEALAGPENVTAVPGGIQVRNSEGEWFRLGEGWSAAVGDDGTRRVLTAGALATVYRPE